MGTRNCHYCKGDGYLVLEKTPDAKFGIKVLPRHWVNHKTGEILAKYKFEAADFTAMLKGKNYKKGFAYSGLRVENIVGCIGCFKCYGRG